MQRDVVAAAATTTRRLGNDDDDDSNRGACVDTCLVATASASPSPRTHARSAVAAAAGGGGGGAFRQEELRDGDFVREALLGQGSYAVVSAAVHVPSQQLVALKQISRHRLRALGLEWRLRWEINVQRTLRHANVVRLLSYYVTPRHITLVLEYCAGGTLAQRLRRARHGRLRESVAARYARHVARALHYLHEHGIVHRDLKLENVLLDGRDVARLADFGWSRKLLDDDDDDDDDDTSHDDVDGDSDTRTTRHHHDNNDNSGDDNDKRTATATTRQRRSCDGSADAARASCARGRRTVCGTLDYLSPEMVTGKPHTSRTDVWSLGVMIAEMVTGAPPFYRDTQQATLEAIRSAPPNLTPHAMTATTTATTAETAAAAAADATTSARARELSPALRELLAAMLCKDAERRPTMADVLAHPWLQKPAPVTSAQATTATASATAPVASRKRACDA